MNALPILCLLTPLLTAAAVFIAPSGGVARARIALGGSVLLVLLAAALLTAVTHSGPVAAQMGGWAAPFGITLIADPLAALLLVAAAVAAVAIVAFAGSDIDAARDAAGFHGFVQIVMTGVVGAFLTGDVFNLYVWFEVMLIGSFALMTLGADKRQLDGAIKYIALNLVATVLLLTAIGLLHAVAGTLNFADLHRVMTARPDDGLARLIAAFFLVAFGIKAALFPVFAWLPASYHTVPVTVAALFAALMTKIGVYSLLRVATLVFPVELASASGLLFGVALATLAIGLAGAVAERHTRRLLGWHVIVSVGILMLGVALGSDAALIAAILYFVHGMLAKAALFLIVGVAERHGAGERVDEAGGLQRLSPWLAAAFLLAALSLIGLPPTPGFWAKLAYVKAGLAGDATVLVVAVLIAGLVSFLPLMRLWNELFWKAPPAHVSMRTITVPAGMAFGIGVLTVAMLLIGLAPASLIALASDAAVGVLDPTSYLDAVGGPDAKASDTVTSVEAARAALATDPELRP